MSLFGTITSDDQVEDAVLAILSKWVPTYMAEVERQIGIDVGFYKRPITYTARTDFDHWPEEQLPMLMVIATGLEDDPPKDGYGKYRATFAVGVAGIVTSNERLYTRRYAFRLGAAVRGALVQHQSLDLALGGNVRGVKLVGGRNNELPTEDDRTIWATRQLFEIEVDDYISEGVGPLAPTSDPQPDPDDPWPDPPTINNPNVNLESIPR